MNDSINEKITSATKWSAVTEVAARLVAPITSVVLAHILAPEAFGVVTTIVMIVTFAEIFTDAGFQKYLIQHEFVDDADKWLSVNVAFWSNFAVSIAIWLVICVFCDKLAELVGNPGLGFVVAIACVSIPLEAFSSIQMALYKRDFDFKTLFKVRMVGILIPLVVTIPLALIFKNFWALVIGNITRDVFNAILLTYFSQWKPRLVYSFARLKRMFSFTMWSMIEAISIWLTSYVDVFIVGTLLSQYYLGLYKTSSAVVGQILGLITATATPILFSALSRLQNNESEFRSLYFKFQKTISIIIMPLGIGIFCFRDFITYILLGSEWTEAAYLIGLWGLTSAFMIVLAHFCSEVYRAKGRPKLSVFAQFLHIIFLWPTVLISVKYGYEVLCLSRSLIRFQGILVNILIMYFLVKISPFKMIRNIIPSLFASTIMLILYYLLPEAKDILTNLLYIVLCSAAYIIVLSLFKEDRKLLFEINNTLGIERFMKHKKKESHNE